MSTDSYIKLVFEEVMLVRITRERDNILLSGFLAILLVGPAICVARVLWIIFLLFVAASIFSYLAMEESKVALDEVQRGNFEWTRCVINKVRHSYPFCEASVSGYAGLLPLHHRWENSRAGYVVRVNGTYYLVGEKLEDKTK